MTPDRTQARRDTIRALIRTREIATQEELRALLRKQRFVVTQATLSRDLAKLGARRASRAGGGTAYELAEAPAAESPAAETLAGVAEMVVKVADNGALVVIHTTPGTASAVALALDQARLPEVLGTLAGDDAIFIAPARHRDAPRLTHALQKLFLKGQNP